MRLDKAELSWEWPVQPLMVLALAAALFVTAQPLFCQTGAHIVTDLEVAPDNFDFLLAPNGDLYAIKKRNTTQHKTEVHVLTAASGYMHRGLEVVTDLEEAPDNFDFLLAPNGDLYAIKKRNTTQHKTEVHVLTAASGYMHRGLEVVTDLEEAPDNFDFLLAPNGDLYAIKKRNTTQHKTEVHVLTAVSGYMHRGLEVVTDLEEAPDNFDFLLAPNGDLYAIKKRNTTQHKTEVHVLTAASGYMHRGLEVATALEEASDRFQCLLGPEKDIYAVKTRNTTSDKTEVHTLSALTNYSSFGVTTCAEGPDGGCGVLHKDITRQCCPPNQHPEFSCASCGPAILVNSCLKPTSSCQLGPPVTQPPHSVISSPPNPSGCGQEPVRNAQPSENCYKRVAPSCWNEVSCGGPHPGLRPSYCYDYYTPVNHYCRRECESSYVVCGR